MGKFKKIFFALTFWMSVQVCADAQSFEGQITYEIDYHVNLPDRPDLDMYQTMVPESLELSLKNVNSLMKLKGGMTQDLIGDILFKAKEKAIYSLNTTSKTATKTPISDLLEADDRQFKAEKMNETTVILGYNCQKYRIRDTEEGTETHVWSAPITNASANLMVYFLESMTQYHISNIQGLPLKIEFKGKEFDLTILASKAQKQTLAASLFVIPKDYQIIQGN